MESKQVGWAKHSPASSVMENIVSYAVYNRPPDWRIVGNAVGTGLGTAIGQSVVNEINERRIDALAMQAKAIQRQNDTLNGLNAATQADWSSMVAGGDWDQLGQSHNPLEQSDPFHRDGGGIFGKQPAANEPYGTSTHQPMAESSRPNMAVRHNQAVTSNTQIQQQLKNRIKQHDMEQQANQGARKVGWFDRAWHDAERGLTREWSRTEAVVKSTAHQFSSDYHQGDWEGYITGAAKEEANVFMQVLDYVTGETGLEPQFTFTPGERLGADIASVGMAVMPAVGDLKVSETGFFNRRYVPCSINPEDVRFSQSTVSYLKQRPGQEPYTLDDIIGSMQTEGWKDDYIDVIKMPEGNYTTLDNSRVLAARRSGINIQTRVHSYGEQLPVGMEKRFEHPALSKVFAGTWGEALEYRIMRQRMSFMDENYPVGSYGEPQVTYPQGYSGPRSY